MTIRFGYPVTTKVVAPKVTANCFIDCATIECLYNELLPSEGLLYNNNLPFFMLMTLTIIIHDCCKFHSFLFPLTVHKEIIASC